MTFLAPLALGAGALALAVVGWSAVEAQAFTVRHVRVPVLPPGSQPIRVLHISDLHLTPRHHREVSWVRSLVSLRPDLVVNTGDNLAHREALPTALEALEPLLEIPGVFVHGSNDYFAPVPKNPASYLWGPSRVGRKPARLPSEDLTQAFVEAGWRDLNNKRTQLTVCGTEISCVGLDDPHLRRDEMPKGSEVTRPGLTLGVVHAPYKRALDALVHDGADLIFAGHTHGGQVCLPGYGALVTNCDLDRGRARGLHGWPGTRPDTEEGRGSRWLHVSAGVGTSPYAPVRLACRPEATLLVLEPLQQED